MSSRLFCAFSVCSVLGCGNHAATDRAGDGGATSTGGATGTDVTAATLTGRCEFDTRLGGFALAMESDFSTISGLVYDRVARDVEYAEVGSDESCVLVERTNPFCDPPCSGGETCVQGGSCESPPTSVDLGAVVVDWLSTALTMHAVQPGNRYFKNDLEHPPVDAARPVRLQAEGGELGAFELHAEGVSLLETSEAAWVVERGKPLEVAWAVGATPGQAKVRMTLNIDQHGASPVTLSCLTEDLGNLAVSSRIIDQFLDFGVSGFATGNIYRETSDHAVLGAGCVDLVLSAHQKRALQVAGHEPCVKDADCKDGKTCDVPKNSCN